MSRACTSADRVPIFNPSMSRSILGSGMMGANFTASVAALWNHAPSSLSLSIPPPQPSRLFHTPLLSTETLFLPLLPSSSPLLPMMVSLSNHTAGLLSAWWLYGWGGLYLSFTLLCLFIFPSLSILLSLLPLSLPLSF